MHLAAAVAKRACGHDAWETSVGMVSCRSLAVRTSTVEKGAAEALIRFRLRCCATDVAATEACRAERLSVRLMC